MTVSAHAPGTAQPPLCNTGVHPPTHSTPYGYDRSQFDWYRATVPASVELLTKAIAGIAGKYPQIVDGKGRFNYLRSRTIMSGGDRVATILHGGANGNPNVEASGERAAALADLLRAGGPHRVTRCDVAVDLWGDGLYSQLHTLADKIAGEHRIGLREVTDRDPSKGNTTYLGSRKSTVFARIYEKGKADRQHYQRDGVPIDMLDGWVRVELEVKPQKEMKEAAASIDPADFWGISAWTQQLASEALNMAPEPIPFHPRRKATDERAFRFMVAQYRNLLQRRCEAVHEGDRDKLAQEIVAALYDDQGEAAA